MATTVSVIGRLVAGVQRNIDLSAAGNILLVSELDASLVKIGATSLSESQLSSLLSHDHAAQSDNQNVTAGNGLTGGGSGATPTLNVGAGDGISVAADAVAVDSTVVRTTGSSMASAANLTFSGNGEVLGLPAVPSADGASASKKYVNDQDALKLSLTGGTMSGAIVLPGAPTADLQASTKKYVDDSVAPKADSTAVVLRDGTQSMSAALNMNGFKVINLAAGTANGDAIRWEQFVTKADDSVVIKKDGSVTFTAAQSMGGFKLTNVGTPLNPADAATKQYVDDTAQGLDVHQEVHLKVTSAELPAYTATGANATKSLTANANGAFPLVQSHQLDLNEGIMITDSPATFDDGIYYLFDAGSAGTPWILKRRAGEDGTPSNELVPGDFFFVSHGDFASTGWVVTALGDLDTDGEIDIDNGDKFTVTQFSGSGTFTAGAGLTLTGSAFSVNVDNASTAIVSNNVVVKDGGITSAKINSSALGNGLTGGSGTALSVYTDGEGFAFSTGQLVLELDGTTLSKSASGLKVAAGGVTNTEIATIAAIALSKLASGSSAQIIVCNGSGVPTYVSSSGDVTVDNVGAFTIGATKVTNSMLAGSIADSKLSTITTANKVSGSAVQLAASGGLQDSTGLKVKVSDFAGFGLMDDTTNKLTIKLATNSGLVVDANGLAVQGGSTTAMTSGTSFAGTATFAVRFAISGETAGRVYKADDDDSVSDKFYVIGFINTTGAVADGDPVVLQSAGSVAVQGTPFSAGDIGKPVYLSGTGTFSTVAPTTANHAAEQIGIVQDTTHIWVQIGLNGVN